LSEDLHKNSSQTNQIDSEKEVNTKQVVLIIFLIVLVVVGTYFFKFHFQLSDNNEVWGTFGDYVGGILNPIIAAFAFYLIAKSYELQRRELGETSKLLKVSTDAQEMQIKVAALTALLNSNLTRINMIEFESNSLLQGKLTGPDGSLIKLYSTEFFSLQDKLEARNYSLMQENIEWERLLKGLLSVI
jgi:large-conductance mechanosensitive channel